MYDWKAKLEELREAIELTDEQKNELALGVSWAMWKVNGSPVKDTRRAELSIRNQLERLIEARGWRWTIQSMEVGFDAYVVMANDDLEYAHGCATPAQSIMDALLSAVEAQP